MNGKTSTAVADIGQVERPIPAQGATVWASDAIARTVRQLGIPYVALNPGSSFRGLHDSLVNDLGNSAPQMLLCLHEESAVALAHGWAKVTGEPMAVVVHSSIGLMHASMGVFNAWCDRTPMLLLGATGPVDAEKRRPWIDWIHTSRDQGALIRGYTKWDDQPASVLAAMEAIVRSWQIARTVPFGPTYVCLDVGLQESQLPEMPKMPVVERFPAPELGAVPSDAAHSILTLLHDARRPLIMMGRVSRSEQGWADRVALAEALGACVVTDLKTAAAFPSRHPLNASHAAMVPSEETLNVVAEADVILALDWVDLGGTLRAAFGRDEVPAKVISISPDQLIHGGWNMDYQALPPVDVYYSTTPEAAVSALLAEIRPLQPRFKARQHDVWEGRKPLVWPTLERAVNDEMLKASDIALTLAETTQGREVCIIRHPFAWAGHFWELKGPLDMLGYDGGAGVGSGPGMTVGAALALRGSGRLPVAVIGDGDFLMGVTALWTAVHYGTPLLMIVANNSAFYNDEMHQERVAKHRGRPVENKWIGQHITSPEVDLAAMASAQGCHGIGPVRTAAELSDAIAQGLAMVDAGSVVVIDVRVQSGYGQAMNKIFEQDK